MGETEQYLHENGFLWNRLTVCQTYMILGGVPYYLSLLDNKMGLPANVDRLFFSEDAELAHEYERLFSSLFCNPQPYKVIIRLLIDNKSGLTRKEISSKLGKESEGNLSMLMADNQQYLGRLRVLDIRLSQEFIQSPSQ